MSDSPKKQKVALDESKQRQMEEEQRRKTQEEERRRREVEERERLRQLETLRKEMQFLFEGVLNGVRKQNSSVFSEDGKNLEKRCNDILLKIKKSNDESQLRALVSLDSQICNDLSQAISRKRRHDEEQKKLEKLEKQRFLIHEAERMLSEIHPEDAMKFDPNGRADSLKSVKAAKEELQKGNPQAAEPLLVRAESTIEQHRKIVTSQKNEWLKRKANAESSSGELQMFIKGLKADEIVMRWLPGEISKLEEKTKEVNEAIGKEDFNAPADILRYVKPKAQEIIKKANEAQIKAEQRDYIARSIAETLESMGFVVSKIQAEHSNHPATAVIFHAKNAARESISVSVPVDGEVWYDMGGYEMKTEARVGGAAAVCDEAEGVLEEVREHLANEFGVKAGELQWEGKDPERPPIKRIDIVTKPRKKFHKGGA